MDELTPKEIHPKLTNFKGTLFLQYQPLKSGNLNLNMVTHRSKMTHVDGQKTATTLETIEKVQNIVLDDRWIKVCELPEAKGTLEERVI